MFFMRLSREARFRACKRYDFRNTLRGAWFYRRSERDDAIWNARLQGIQNRPTSRGRFFKTCSIWNKHKDCNSGFAKYISRYKHNTQYGNLTSLFQLRRLFTYHDIYGNGNASVNITIRKNYEIEDCI